MTGHDPISEPLNAWLDDFVQGRSGPPASDREVDEVTTAAGTFHRLAREGERYAAATSPMAKRWEDVMQATTIPATRTNVEPRTSRRAVRFVPGLGDAGHLAAILAVMVLVGAMFAHLSPRHDDPADDLALVPGNDTATPAPGAGWLTPVDPAECTIEPRSLDEIGAIMRDPGEWPARQYLPVSPADPGDAEEAAEVYRTWQACYLAALPYEKRAVETPRYISEIAEYRHLDYANYASFEEWRAANEDLRLAYAPADPSALFRYSNALQPLDDMDPDADFADYWESYSSAVDPIYVRILPDGRLVSLVTTLYAENSKNPVTVYPDGPWIADVIFFAPDPTRDGAWAVDQRLSICVFSCGLLYDQVEEDAWYLWPDSASPATPDASPEKALSDASSSEFDWLAPVTADECVVAPRPVDQVATWLENPPDRNSTAYLAVEPTDADTAASAAQSARTWIACGSNDLAAQRHAMESPPFIFYQGTNSITDPTRYDGFESWHHTVESLREVYLTDDPMSYFAFSPDVTPTADQQQYGGAIGLNLLAQPKHAHALPDGRVALPLTWVYQSGGIPAETIAEERSRQSC